MYLLCNCTDNGRLQFFNVLNSILWGFIEFLSLHLSVSGNSFRLTIRLHVKTGNQKVVKTQLIDALPPSL